MNRRRIQAAQVEGEVETTLFEYRVLHRDRQRRERCARLEKLWKLTRGVDLNCPASELTTKPALRDKVGPRRLQIRGVFSAQADFVT